MATKTERGKGLEPPEPAICAVLRNINATNRSNAPSAESRTYPAGIKAQNVFGT